MKLKRLFVILIVILLAMTLFACNGGGGGGGDDPDPEEIEVPVLDDLTNYSTDVKYYQVDSIDYGDVVQQKNKLEARQDEILNDEDKEYDDLSVPVKIFVNADADEIIRRMGVQALPKEKMIATVEYMAGDGDSPDLDTIVNGGEWVNDPNWSFFDDWDYLDMLQEKADEAGSSDDDADNVQRQRRKMMGQVFDIGMTGDEFGRFVIGQMLYAMEVTETMHLDYYEIDPDIEYDDYVKEDLSFDTLSYFKAFEQFVQNRSQTVQLYGYYYDYNKASYEAMDNETFEKELAYRHQDIYTNTEFKEYVNIQRSNYINSYRYSYSFYRDFYQVHFQFQGLLEQYDREVYDIDTALPDQNLTYSREMQRGMDAGFAQQLVLMDTLYVYSADEETLIEYNTANTGYEQVKNTGAKPARDEKKMLLQYEQLKAVDYVLNEMNNSQLSNVLRYHILSYSGDMIRNIQSEKKNVVLEEYEILRYETMPGGAPVYQAEIEEHEVTVGRTQAMVAQLVRSYNSANPQNQYNIAVNTSWTEIRGEVKDTLDHDYTQYSNGTDRLEAFEDMLIKKKLVNPDGTDYDENNPDHDSALTREQYDTDHNISRFLNSHETVLRYSTGQVKIELSAKPNNRASTQTAYDLSGHNDGTYMLGNNDGKGENGIERTMPDGPDVIPEGYGGIIDEIIIAGGSIMREGLEEEESSEEQFFIANEENVALENKASNPGLGTSKMYTFVFEGWYLDFELKYKVDLDDEINYDLVLYPGYTVTKSPV